MFSGLFRSHYVVHYCIVVVDSGIRGIPKSIIGSIAEHLFLIRIKVFDSQVYAIQSGSCRSFGHVGQENVVGEIGWVNVRHLLHAFVVEKRFKIGRCLRDGSTFRLDAEIAVAGSKQGPCDPACQYDRLCLHCF